MDHGVRQQQGKVVVKCCISPHRNASTHHLHFVFSIVLWVIVVVPRDPRPFPESRGRFRNGT